MAGQAKLDFAHSLRGVAALLVAFSHLFGFWQAPVVSVYYLHSPTLPANADVPWIASAYFGLIRGDAASQAAIAMFFLISGFVIPFAFPRQSPVSFLAGRFFRIWPLYACGLAISILSVGSVSAFFGRAYIPSETDIISHLAFVQDLAGVRLIDGIVWTLNIEVRFYLVCALIAPWLVQGKALRIVGLAAAAALPAIYASHFMRDSSPALGLASTAMFISLMFVGTILNFLHRGIVDVRVAVLSGVALLAMFAVQCHLMPFSTSGGSFIFPGPQYLVSYLIGAGSFVIAFIFRARFPANPVLRHLGDISYPLYVLHAMMGQALMRVLVEFLPRPDTVLLLTIGVVWAMSYVAHVAVEVPTHNLGRMIANPPRRLGAL